MRNNARGYKIRGGSRSRAFNGGIRRRVIIRHRYFQELPSRRLLLEDIIDGAERERRLCVSPATPCSKYSHYLRSQRLQLRQATDIFWRRTTARRIVTRKISRRASLGLARPTAVNPLARGLRAQRAIASRSRSAVFP